MLLPGLSRLISLLVDRALNASLNWWLLILISLVERSVVGDGSYLLRGLKLSRMALEATYLLLLSDLIRPLIIIAVVCRLSN
jgi:hypothetical protein